MNFLVGLMFVAVLVEMAMFVVSFVSGDDPREVEPLQFDVIGQSMPAADVEPVTDEMEAVSFTSMTDI